MKVGKYYVITDELGQYENCLSYYGPFDTEIEAEKCKADILEEVTIISVSYYFVSIVKVQK